MNETRHQEAEGMEQEPKGRRSKEVLDGSGDWDDTSRKLRLSLEGLQSDMRVLVEAVKKMGEKIDDWRAEVARDRVEFAKMLAQTFPRHLYLEWKRQVMSEAPASRPHSKFAKILIFRP